MDTELLSLPIVEFIFIKIYSGTKLLEHLKRSYTEFTTSSEFNGSYVDSDNDSEGSYSDLINEYTASKFQTAKHTFNSTIDETKTGKATDVTTTFGKNNLVESDNMLTKLQGSSATAQGSLCEQPNTFGEKEHDESLQNKEVFQRKSSEISASDDIEFRSIKAKVEDVVKWTAQLLLALEKLHVLGVICWYLMKLN